MMPTRAPINTFSALWHSFATSGSESRAPLRLIRASALDTSMAADELRPGTDGHFTSNQQARARGRMPDLAEHDRNTENVVRPYAFAPAGQVLQIEFKLLRKFFRPDDQFPVRPRRNGHAGGKTDGAGHYEAVVVVGMLAQQIDPPGAEKTRGRDPNRSSKC